MKRTSLTLDEVLDEAGEVAAAVAAPWIGVLWITSVPLRMSQAHLAARLIELGDEARKYGQYLHGIAAWVALAFVLSLLGRAVYVRALNLRLRTGRAPGREALRVPLVSFVGYLYAAALVEVVAWALCWSIVALPVGIVCAGLAAATAPLLERLSLSRPIQLIARNSGAFANLGTLVAVYGVALLLAAVNLYFLFRFGLWLADGFMGAAAARWHGLLSWTNRRLWLSLLAGGWLAVEPFWLASLTVYVLKMRARASGEDLRLWFARLREAGPSA